MRLKSGLKICNVEGKKVKPLHSNTGVEDTPKGIEALIDWFAPTFPLHGVEGVETVVKDILQMRMDEFIMKPRGHHGYKAQMSCGNIMILYDGNREMGTHLIMTGQGCRQYEAVHGKEWQELFRRVIANGGRCARLDPAIDDYDGHYTVELLEDKINKRELRTLFN